MIIIKTANELANRNSDSSTDNYFISICVVASIKMYQLGTTFVMLSSQKNNLSDTIIKQAIGFYPGENTISYRGLTSQDMPSKLRNRLLFPDFMTNPFIRHITFKIDKKIFSKCNRFIARELDIGPDAKQENIPAGLPPFQTCEHNCWRYSCNFLENHVGIIAEDYLLMRPFWNLPTTIYWQLGAARFEKVSNDNYRWALCERGKF